MLEFSLITALSCLTFGGLCAAAHYYLPSFGIFETSTVRQSAEFGLWMGSLVFLLVMATFISLRLLN